MCSRMTRIAISAPKALVLLLVPSILTNLPAEAESFNGISSIAGNHNIQGPVIIEEVTLLRRISYNIHETYNWISRSTSHVFQHVPEVKGPIRKSIEVISGLFFSILLLFSPKFWWSKLPKISRKRTRRRKRKSRGPPTRFSARLRHLPVQFTGELPRRTRRPNKIKSNMEAEIILPNESKEERTVRLMDKFDAKVAKYNPGMLIRSVSTIINALGYFHEEDIAIRRSARLRGIRPEYDGLHFESRTRTRRARPSTADDSFDDIIQPLEVIAKKPKQNLLDQLLAYFGFYTESEIQRRKSLRLQGLDPENEGLTWGTKRRQSPRKKPKLLAFFKDYHDDDEVFFNYHEESAMDRFKAKVAEFDPGYIIRCLSVLFAQLGYYKEETIVYNEELHEDPKTFEELVEPTSEGLVSDVFKYFGYYSSNEIIRRRSLRLQGLDPEYEGLTWGKRHRRQRLMPFFKDYHDDDEVFFNYHEENAMERFRKRVARFNPGLLRIMVSSIFAVIGYHREESFEGVEEMVDTNETLDDLMEPSNEWFISKTFAYFGYYSKNEIRRRQSLRLQGLEPEFEGLTWGKRRRSKKSIQFAGDYHDDDEVFFNYHEEDNTLEKFKAKVKKFKPSIVQGLVSSLVSIMGFYKEENLKENVHDLSFERKSVDSLMRTSSEWIVIKIFRYFNYFTKREIARRRSLRLQGLDPDYEGLTWGSKRRMSIFPSLFGNIYEDHENDVTFEYHEHEDGVVQRWTDYFLHKIGYLQFEDLPEEDHSYVDSDILDDQDLDERNLNYVQIPQESFVNSQRQHEVFENSYSFETTEGFEDTSTIEVTKEDSCLGVILILAIPILLLMSLAILDSSNSLFSEDSSTTKTLSALYSSIWSVPKWCCSLSTQMVFDIFNGLMIGLIKLGSWIIGLFFEACFVFVYSYQTLKNATFGQETFADVPVYDNVNYDQLIHQILNDESFKTALKQGLPNENSVKVQLSDMIQSRFDELVQKIEQNEVQTNNMEIAASDQDNQIKSIMQAHEQMTNELKIATSTLQTKVQENNANIEAIKTLHEKILTLNEEISQLDGLLKNCCKSAEVHIEYVQKFIEAQKDQFLTRDEFQAEISTIVQLVHDTFIEKSKESIHEFIDLKLSSKPSNLTLDPNALTRWDIEDMVKSALTIYGADKTGAFDFALETAGGSVVSTRCTQMYTDTMLSYSWLGMSIWLPLPIWGPTTNPRTAIQPGVMPGECWAFKGHEGYLVVKLAMPVKPTRFSIEHIPKSLSPNGKIDSAPKDFYVFGLQEEKDPNKELLGRFTYDQDGEPLQFFPVDQVRSYTFSFVELHILNNHGNEKYTCLYRFRVHGSL